MWNKQNIFTVLAFLVTVVAPILIGEGYTGSVPTEWVPIASGLTALVSILIRWYKETHPVNARKWNL